MRELVKSALRAVGLSTRCEADNLRRKVEDRERDCQSLRDALKTSRKREAGLADRSAVQERLIGELKQDVRRWKELTDAARAKEKGAAKAAEDATAKAHEYAAANRDLKGRLETAETALLVSRDQLMATETKLDLLEAAVNLLDQRTRSGPGTKA